MKIIITGGSGFIGSAVVRHLINETNFTVINIDCLTYAGNQQSIKEVKNSPRFFFENVNICNSQAIKKIFNKYQPDKVMHLAAESHVDRSIDAPSNFIQTNIVGTFTLLEAARSYFISLKKIKRENFLFHHISTDEVYGDLAGTNSMFTEQTPYAPSSPYSASKAASDHLVRAWERTYGLPTIITNCSNNYGPFHFPEKLIPHIIISALKGKPLPIYGNGLQIRDWLYVDDHAKALTKVITEGKSGNTYNIGGHNEKTNIEVVEAICDLLEELVANKPLGVNQYKDLINFVKDRPGHDTRYAIDAAKIYNNLGWRPQETFETGLKKTVKWYLKNTDWWESVLSGEYKLKRQGD